MKKLYDFQKTKREDHSHEIGYRENFTNAKNNRTQFGAKNDQGGDAFLLSQGYVTNRIKQLCGQRNMSMYALSKKTGISQSSLSNLIRRGSTPTFRTFNAICDGLGIMLAQFFSYGHEAIVISEEQREVLQTWGSLSDEEKQAVRIYIRGMKLA